MSGHKYLQTVLFAASVIAIQLATFFTGTGHYLTQLTMSGYYSLVIIGLCLLIGYAGQISIGHAGFFAIGGYTTAFLTTYDLSSVKAGAVAGLLSKTGMLVTREDLYGGQALSLHPWAACLFAIAITVVIAYLIGGPVLKLKGHYLAMATLGFGTIVYKIVLGSEKFGAADGISDVPGFLLLPGLEVSGKPSMRVMNYYISWGLVIAGVMLLLNLVHSRVGRALRAIHGAEDAAGAMGIDTAKFKLKASIIKSVRYVAIVAIGGMANLWGSLIMGFILNFLSLRGYFGTYDDAVFGAILIAIMLFAPEGLLRRELFKDVRAFFSGKKPREGRQ
ncbi:MAG: branched-chain amino acid ABC transporter permease [Nitrospirae bacterium]|nr:branched-chain amino acid ABC transporter permease [Nitrospirota bacterium]